MINFKEHWLIFKQPKPLLADAKVGDLVKLRNGSYSQIVEVKDGSVFKYQNPEVIGSVALFWCDENGDTSRWGKVKDVDIVHTEPLAPEGTKEWAWQQMLLGNEVWNPELDSHKTKRTMSQVLSIYYIDGGNVMVRNLSGERSVLGVQKDSYWTNYAEPTGWQIYEEPEPKYKAGDFVEIRNWYSGTKHLAQIDSIDHEIHIGSHRFDASGKSVMERLPQLSIIRKLKPSEVVVEIGCLSGTVRPVSTNGTHIWFHLISAYDETIAIIRISSLDATTRSLVESLLKAQEEE